MLVLDAGSRSADGAWVLARVAGLPLALRAVLTLAEGGATHVRLACGTAEAAALRNRIDGWRGRRGVPTVSLAEGGRDGQAPRGSSHIIADGRFLFTAADVRRTIEERPPEIATSKTGSKDSPTSSVHPRPIPVGPAGRDIDLRTAAGRREAERRLLTGLRKGTDGWFSRRLNRPVSLRLTRLLAGLQLPPNFYTLVTFAVGVAGGTVSAFGGYWNLLAGGALFQVASMLDGVDGEIARLTYRCSRTGEWLDSICDDLTNAIYLAGVTLGVYRDTGLLLVPLLGATAVGLDLLTRTVLYVTLARKGLPVTLLEYESRVKALGHRATGLEKLIAVLVPLVKRDLHAWLAFLFAAAGAAWLTLVLWAAGAAIGAPVVLTRVHRLVAESEAASS